MIDISRGFNQVSLPDDFAQTAWENWKLLYPFFVCETFGRVHVDIGKFTVNKAYVKRLSTCILIKNFAC
jgi:hypothetical protein